MKIIHLVLGKANPERMNGVNKLVHEMLSTQHRLGYNVELWGITPNPIHDYPDRAYRTRLFQAQKNKLQLPTKLKAAIDGLTGPTVFHLHGGFIPEFYLSVQRFHKCNIPYCYTPHGALAPAALQRRAWKKKIYFELFEKRLIQKAAVLIATGRSVLDNAQQLVQPQRAALIPNGQPPIPQVSAAPREEEGLTIGYCGRIAMEHKGLDLLLDGFRGFLDQGGRAKLHLIGDGAEMPKLKQQAEQLNLLPHLKFYGARYGDEKFALLKTFDCFIHSSRMEGFPASVLEACASGLPCVVSKHTNVDTYIRDFKAGWVIENNDPKGIAETLLRMEKDYQANRFNTLGQNAQRMIEERFDWAVICEELYQEYNYACTKNHALSATA